MRRLLLVIQVVIIVLSAICLFLLLNFTDIIYVYSTLILITLNLSIDGIGFILEYRASVEEVNKWNSIN